MKNKLTLSISKELDVEEQEKHEELMNDIAVKY